MSHPALHALDANFARARAARELDLGGYAQLPMEGATDVLYDPSTRGASARPAKWEPLRQHGGMSVLTPQQSLARQDDIRGETIHPLTPGFYRENKQATLQRIIKEEYNQLLSEQDPNELLADIRRTTTPPQIIPPEEVEWGLTPPENRPAVHAGAWMRHSTRWPSTARQEAQSKLETDLINRWKEQGALPQKFNLDWYRWHQRDKTDPPGRRGPRFKPLEWEGPSPSQAKDPRATT